MTKNTLIATCTAILIGTGGAAAGAATKSSSPSPCKALAPQALRQDVRAAVKKARQAAFTGTDRVAAAKPILDQAVKDGTIEAGAEQKILERIERGPRRRRP